MALKKIETHFSPAALEAFKLANKGMKVSEIAKQLEVKDDSVYKYISRVKTRFITEIKKLKDELNF
jgi:predicted transcriptional regulator